MLVVAETAEGFGLREEPKTPLLLRPPPPRRASESSGMDIAPPTPKDPTPALALLASGASNSDGSDAALWLCACAVRRIFFVASCRCD